MNVVDSPNCSCHQGVPETNSQYLFIVIDSMIREIGIPNQLIFL